MRTHLPYPSALRLSRRQLLARPNRTLTGVIGIAVALLLVLTLRGILAGMEQRLTAYIEATGADVIVAQEGITTMHMTQSALPPGVATEVAAVPGVARASGLLYRQTFVERRDGTRSGAVALVGGGPDPQLVDGTAPRGSQIVLDRALTRTLGVQPGDRVRVLGSLLTVAGEIEGTAAITGSFAVVDRELMETLAGASGVVSYVLVEAAPGIDPTELAARIERQRAGVTAAPLQRFAASERRVVGDMTIDIVRGMTMAGFLIGVAVTGLVAFSQVLTQLRDYGVLRALGLSARAALGLVATQVLALVVAGFALAIALVAVLALLLPALSPMLTLAVRPGDVVGAAAVAGAVALCAAVVPIMRVVRLEPASVFRRSP